jgi:hypothetical protein
MEGVSLDLKYSFRIKRVYYSRVLGKTLKTMIGQQCGN